MIFIIYRDAILVNPAERELRFRIALLRQQDQSLQVALVVRCLVSSLSGQQRVERARSSTAPRRLPTRTRCAICSWTDVGARPVPRGIAAKTGLLTCSGVALEWNEIEHEVTIPAGPVSLSVCA